MKVNNLQALLKTRNIDGFIFSSSDEYLNEYVPEYNNRIKYLTNFKGSVAFVVVLQNSACIFVDSRYTLSLKEQVDTQAISTGDYSLENIIEYIKKNTQPEAKIAINLKTTSLAMLNLLDEQLKNIGRTSIYLTEHLVDKIWENRPQKPKSKVYIHEDIYGSASSNKKIELIANRLKENNIDYILLTALDNIAWLLNIRGSDIPCNPLSLSKLIISQNQEVYLFIDKGKIADINQDLIKIKINLYNEDDLEKFLEMVDKNRRFGVSLNSPAYYSQLLKSLSLETVVCEDFCALLKAKKNHKEIQSIEQAHIRDGVYLCRLYYKIFSNPESYDEMSIDQELSAIKSQDNLYKGESFPSIVGIDANGAIVHYRSESKTCKKLKQDSYLLIDCGSQYLDGTTDITRSFALSSPSYEYKKHFTLILKGHIAVANTVFKAGTTGSEIDKLARQPLNDHNLSYGHGTGHGVGFFLCVHEGPQSLSPNNKSL